MASGTRVVLSIRGKKHSLWRAVDHDGNVLDMRVAEPPQYKGRQTIFRAALLKGYHYAPRVINTDTLKSYGAAKREILPAVVHRQHKRLKNRAENSHQPTRLREKKMKRFKSARTGTALSALAFGLIAGHFQRRRHRMSARDYCTTLQDRFQGWNAGDRSKTGCVIPTLPQSLLAFQCLSSL